MAIKPKLKVGTLIWRSRFTNELRVGTRRRNTVITETCSGFSTESLVRLLDGRRTTRELSEFTGAAIEDLERLISILLHFELLDFESYDNNLEPGSLRLSNPTDSESIDSVSLRQIRFKVERDAITFRSGQTDGGRIALKRRSEFKILIFNTNRIAIALAGSLKSAGFEKIRVIDRSPKTHRTRFVQGEDLVGGFFRNSEILHLKERLLTENLSLGLNEDFANPNLIIAVGAPPFDTQQRWLNEGTPHLVIDYENSAEVRVGPLVIPGVTPCLNCIELAEIENGLPLPARESLKSYEVPAGLALYVSGLVNTALCEFADGGKSPLIGRTLDIALHDFLSPEWKSWSQHHSCGCRN